MTINALRGLRTDGERQHFAEWVRKAMYVKAFTGQNNAETIIFLYCGGDSYHRGHDHFNFVTPTRGRSNPLSHMRITADGR